MPDEHPPAREPGSVPGGRGADAHAGVDADTDADTQAGLGSPPPDPGLRHEFSVIRTELLLLAEDLAIVNDELDEVRDGTHPFVARVDADLAAVRSSLGHIGDDLAIATMTVQQVLVGLEQLIRAADDGAASAN